MAAPTKWDVDEHVQQREERTAGNSSSPMEPDILKTWKSVHVCPIPGCNARFTKPSRLVTHVRVHTGERPFKCEHEGCGRSYTRRFHLTRHKTSHVVSSGGGLNSLFECEFDACEESYQTVQKLKQHIASRHHSTLYKCMFDDCNESFKKHQTLLIHQAKHTQELPFKCSVEGCGKCFAVPSKLKRHLKIHQGYPCEKCEAVSGTWTEKRQHMAQQHPIEHRCEKCGNTFAGRHRLRTHRATHAMPEDVRLFACEHEGCGRKYTRLNNLKQHVLARHEGNMVSCEVPGCGKTFTFKGKLTDHLKSHELDRQGSKAKEKKKRKGKLRVSWIKRIVGNVTQDIEGGMAAQEDRGPEKAAHVTSETPSPDTEQKKATQDTNDATQSPDTDKLNEVSKHALEKVARDFRQVII